jgi:iron complex outermembrane recepter protein
MAVFRAGNIWTMLRYCSAAIAATGAIVNGNAQAQSSLPASNPEVLPLLVVTGTRIPQDPFALPMSIDLIGSDILQSGQLQVNLSETLSRVPGINVQNRNNAAQDLQISSRGFGARASFGVRGIRLFSDGIPAAMPDGQGQVSHFSLGSADRVEVLRGPFSALYGNASGGVIQIFTRNAPSAPTGSLGMAVAENRTWRASAQAAARFDRLGLVADFSNFSSDGFRPQSASRRESSNVKLDWFADTDSRATLVANKIKVPLALDPLGLTRAEFTANPDQTTAAALQFNTRKTFEQSQLGLVLEHHLSAQHQVRAMVYGGNRQVRQFQSIPVATQSAPTQPGGVIDFARIYQGADIRYSGTAQIGAAKATLVAGVGADELKEQRKGFNNFIGTTVGVLGTLRRNEENRVRSQDVYAQGDIALGDVANLFAGVRNSKVRFASQDRYITAGNPDDSGSVRFQKTTPVLGATWHASKQLNVYASTGRGFETPTFNELAYRPGGQTGLNFGLLPSVSDSFEMGAKWRDTQGVSAAIAAYHTKTANEIVTLTNSGGRATFTNAGRTSRDGVEATLAFPVVSGVDAYLSASAINPRYRDGFLTCTSVPCTRPATAISVGNRIPGVPLSQAFAEVKWSPLTGLVLALEFKRQGRLYVNDVNTDSVPAANTGNAAVSYEWRKGGLKVLTGVRVENLADKRYAQSVIVNEANGRYFEPSAGRNWLASIVVSNQW